MANIIHCVFCNNSDDIISSFTAVTLKKCQQILKFRKEHKLKFKDVVLPVELFESGFHRQCYKSFTGLMKKYYTSTSTTIAEPKEKRSNTPQDLSSVLIPNSQSIEPLPYSLSTATTVIPDPITIPETIITVDLAPSTSQENGVKVESLDSISEDGVPIESDVKRILGPKNQKTLNDESFENLKEKEILQKAALLLRKSILQDENNKIPENVTTHDEEVSVPQDLADFYFTLITGSNRKRKICDQSYIQDMVNAVHNEITEKIYESRKLKV